jgi:carbamoyl-phosphate synthase small subunit
MNDAVLVLSDGTLYRGQGFGDPEALNNEDAAGELVFNTSMSGYQEIMTDPSYTGQIVVFTSAHVGNYGCDALLSESGTAGSEETRLRPKCAGIVLRNLYDGILPRDRLSLNGYMKRYGITGITGIDTRALTLHLRDRGSMNGMICRTVEALERVRALSPMEGRALARETGCGIIPPGSSAESGPESSLERRVLQGPAVVMVDYGLKSGILRELERCGASVTVVPASAEAEEILALRPDGVLLSNGPGDPGVLDRETRAVAGLIGKVPLFGICLGHQLLALALGGNTRKMDYGHHGGNHPVREESSGRVYVTSQNHGFEVDPDSLPEDVEISWRNLNDGSVEGIRHRRLPVSSVQFHPEASPGPREAVILIDRWTASLAGGSDGRDVRERRD